MGLILDTNVFIHCERSDKPIDFSQWEEYGDVYISAVTASELLVGVHYAQSDAQRTRRSAFVEAKLGGVSNPLICYFLPDILFRHYETVYRNRMSVLRSR